MGQRPHLGPSVSTAWLKLCLRRPDVVQAQLRTWSQQEPTSNLTSTNKEGSSEQPSSEVPTFRDPVEVGGLVDDDLVPAEPSSEVPQ